MIVKLQRPLFSTMREPAPWYAYDLGRTVQRYIPEASLPARVIRAMGDDVKGYFEATGTGHALLIGARVSNQKW